MQCNCILIKVSLEPLGNRKDKCGRRSLICEANFLTKKAHRVWDRVSRSSINYNLALCSTNLYLKTAWDFVSGSDCRQSYFIKRKGSGNEWVSRMESAVGIHFRRGKQQVSRLLSRWNLSVYSSVWTSRNPDFDLGVDFVDTFSLYVLF